MPPALTPKVPLTAVANQGTEEMATTVQVRACQVFPTFSLVLTTFYGKQITLKMFRHNITSEFVFVLKSLITFSFRRRRMPDQLSCFPFTKKTVTKVMITLTCTVPFL